MPKVKKIRRATETHKCDFCKSTIEVGQKYARSVVKDAYGSYSLRYHIDCDRTAALNALVTW